MSLQQAETVLSPVPIPEGETFTYCAECGNQVSLGSDREPFYINLQGLPVCEGCAIVHQVLTDTSLALAGLFLLLTEQDLIYMIINSSLVFYGV